MAQTRTPDPKSGRDNIIVETDSEKPFGKINFIGMIICGALIVIGFLLMLGEGSTFENFNPDIFSTRRIVVGPALAFLGFAGMAVAIVLDPSRKRNKESKKQ